ncbi:MAG: DUF3796 domain-containing protein, partial [Raoultibacter sp.]
MSRIVTQYSWVLGFFGCLGFSGITGDPANLLFFAMFGSFSNLWWAKMSGIDERLIVNRALAGSSVFM